MILLILLICGIQQAPPTITCPPGCDGLIVTTASGAGLAPMPVAICIKIDEFCIKMMILIQTHRRLRLVADHGADATRRRRREASSQRWPHSPTGASKTKKLCIKTRSFVLKMMTFSDLPADVELRDCARSQYGLCIPPVILNELRQLFKQRRLWWPTQRL